MGAHSRRKGARGELELAARLGAEKISRTGHTGPDLIWLDRYVEVKRRAKPLSAKISSLLDDTAIVIERADNAPWIVHLSLDTLEDILNERQPR